MGGWIGWKSLWALDRFKKIFFWNWDLGCGFFLLGPIETTFRKYTFHKNLFSIPIGIKMSIKLPIFSARQISFVWYGTAIFVTRPSLSLAVSVVLAPWEVFFDFSFPSYSRFCEGTPQMRQNFVSRNCRNFAALEGSLPENGYNSETKSPKRLPKVPKRPQRPGLVTV